MKTTASLQYNKTINKTRRFDGTISWGLNKPGDHESEHALLAEASWRLNKFALYSRYELTEKSADELVLDKNIYGGNSLFPVHAGTVGVNYDLLSLHNTRLALGTQLTV